MALSIALIGFGALVLVLCIFASSFLFMYWFIKKAVKNGVLEALEEYHSQDDCEE